MIRKLFYIIFLVLLACPFHVFSTGNYSTVIKINNFGYRINDEKKAIVVQDPGASAQILGSSDDSVITNINSISYYGNDVDSGDEVWFIDFTGFEKPGEYYLYVPSLNVRSYDFEIKNDIYNIVGTVAMKSYYYQRCNHTKGEPYSGPWQDGVCHADDFDATHWTGGGLAGHDWISSQPDYGVLDLHGGWHDAGDYQKTPHWEIGVSALLWAYEINPDAWFDGQLNIPESGNGIPDILDEISWELDFYVRMQRPDGHFLSAQGGSGGNIASPPSQSDEYRRYIDEWPGQATGLSVLKLAHAAILYRSLGQTAIADKYEQAATNGWNWLKARSLSGSANRYKCSASSAVYRMDPLITSAKNFVESFASWGSLNPANYDNLKWAIWHYLANPSGDAGIKNSLRTRVENNLINTIFSVKDAYSGLRGDQDNVWDWHWGSNQNQGAYASCLVMAHYFGITGSRTANEILNQAQNYLHYFLGRNTMNMVYLSSMAQYGGEHSSFQFFHSWFSHTGGNGENGNANYNGKPAGVFEPLYPYYVDDDQASLYGPAPGIMVGGPNWQYGESEATWEPPANQTAPAKAYRDFSVGCDWGWNPIEGEMVCRAASWEISENSLGYQGPFMCLVSYFMTAPNLLKIANAIVSPQIMTNGKPNIITFSAEISSLVTVTNATLTLNINGSITNLKMTNKSGNNYQYSIVLPWDINKGISTPALQAIDTDGNIANYQYTYYIRSKTDISNPLLSPDIITNTQPKLLSFTVKATSLWTNMDTVTIDMSSLDITPQLLMTNIPPGTANYQCTYLLPAKQKHGNYPITITAVDKDTNSSSVQLNLTIIDQSPPTKPVIIRADADKVKVILEWTASDESGIKAYKICKGMINNNYPITNAMGNQTLWTDRDIINSKTYYYRVIAIDGAGNESDPSDEASAKIPPLEGLIQIRPNFINISENNSPVWFYIEVMEDNTHIKIGLYDIIGKRIKTITDKTFDKGIAPIYWGIDDKFEEKVATGLYIAVIKVGKLPLERRKIMIIR